MSSQEIIRSEPDDDMSGSPVNITNADTPDSQQHTGTASGAQLQSPVRFDTADYSGFSRDSSPSLEYIEAPSSPRNHSPSVVPDSQEDSPLPDLTGNNTEEDEAYQAGQGGAQWQPPSFNEESFKTIDTVLIPGGAKVKYPLHKEGFNVNGRLASEHPDFEGMEEVGTQQATQELYDQRRRGGQLVSLRDESDVVCILHPTSPAAYRAVQLIARTCPQHILQNEGLSRNLDYDVGSFQEAMETRPDASNSENNEFDGEHREQDTEEHVEHGPHAAESSSKDIAIRFSSRVHDACLGWVFGRNANKCDLPLVSPNESIEEAMRISNSHFRIFLNENGIIMLEDTSTNGTWVDDIHLEHKTNNPNAKSKRTINAGTIIRIIMNKADQCMRFVVSTPPRDRAILKYQQNVQEWLSLVKQMGDQRAIAAKAAAQGNLMAPPAVIPFADIRRNAPVTSMVPPSIVAANEQYTYGMRWNGGEKYNVVGHVGKGAFADVYKLSTKEDGELFAVKEIEKRRFLKEGILNHKANNEIEVMKNLNHPNIVDYIGYTELPTHLYIIMEYVPYGDLSQYVNSDTAMPEYLCRYVAHQMMSALEYLHKSNVTHRDIKPDNILVASKDPFKVKLSDFGLSKVIHDNETFMKTFCGTLLYCAPEIYPDYANVKAGLPRRRRRRDDGSGDRATPYKQSVDIWAFAAVMFHLMCGRPPFTGTSENYGAVMLETIMSNTVDYGRLTGAGVSPEGVDFVKNMLILEPSERASDAECLAHPWIADLSRAEMADVDMGGFEEENQELDASQLSIQERQAEKPSGDGDEAEGLEADEITQRRRSEHFQAEYDNSHPAGLQPDESYGSIPSYDTIPMTSNFDNARRNTDMPAGNRLFGEIGNSALRSSGLLGQTAYAALDMAMEGNRDGSVSASGGDKKDVSSGATDSHVTTSEVAQQHHHHHHTRHSRHSRHSHHPPHPPHPSHPPHHPHHPHHPQIPEAPVLAEPATSLQSTAVQIGRLNMASPESTHSMPSPDNQPESPSAPANTGSKRPSLDVHPAHQHEPKRTKTHRSSTKPRARHGPAEASIEQHQSKASGSHFEDGPHSREVALQESQPHQITSGEGADDPQGQQPQESAQGAHSEAVVSRAQEHHQQDTAISESQAITQRHNGSTGGGNSISTSTAHDNPVPPSGFKVPQVPERPPLGKLQVLPGSVSGFVQKAKGAEKTVKDRQSKGFDEQFAITYKTRWLFFGRCEEEIIPYSARPKLDYTHITHPNVRDIRVGKKGIDLGFWRPGIEVEEAEGKDWIRANDFWAIVMNRSSVPLLVNGVPLRKRQDREAALYGKLYTGDILTVFEQEEPGKGIQFLKFECEFYRGLSKQRRPEGEPPFTIEVEPAELARKRWEQEEREAREASAARGSHEAAGAAKSTTPGL